jgi:multidrug efflux pump subunit AcrA (membrane-fusion protein)
MPVPPPFTRQGIADFPPVMPQKRRSFAVISFALSFIILLVGGALAVWWFSAKSVPNVTLTPVSSQNISQDIGGGGIVFPRQQVNISYPASERVVSVLVKAGDHVNVNQPVIQLDATQLNIQIQQAANDVAAAQAFLNSVSATGNPVSIAQAQQQLQVAKDRYNALIAQSHNGNLVATMSGVVTAVNVTPGTVFAADAPLLTIMDESTVIVHAKIPLTDLGMVHIGQQATVTPSALPGVTVRGTVTSIVPQADPQTDTFEVWVSVANTDGQLLPGMSAFVHIQSSSKALVVPRLAVLNPGGQAAVFVVRDQRAHLQHVQVIDSSPDAVYISQGVTTGDEVVLVGIDKLQDDQPVHVSSIEQNTAVSS